MGVHWSSPKKPKKPTVDDVDKAVLTLKAQRKKLADQARLLEARIERHTEVARQLVRQREQAKALMALQKKKLVERQLTDLGGLQLNIDSMIQSVERQKQTSQLVAVLKAGSEALKALQQQVSVEDIQRLTENTAEAKAYQEEVSAALSQSLAPEQADAAALELQEMEAVLLTEQQVALPTVPATQVQGVAAQTMKAATAAVSLEQDQQEEEGGHREDEAVPSDRAQEPELQQPQALLAA